MMGPRARARGQPRAKAERILRSGLTFYEINRAEVQLKLHHIEEAALVDVDLADGQSRDPRPRAVRVVAILKELAGGDETGEKHPATTEDGAVLRLDKRGEALLRVDDEVVLRVGEGRERR